MMAEAVVSRPLPGDERPVRFDADLGPGGRSVREVIPDVAKTKTQTKLKAKGSAITEKRELAAIAAEERASGRLEPPLFPRALLAEDNTDLRQIFAMRLAMLGLEVTAVADGLQALEQFQGADPPFALMLMDMEMPVLDGYEATRRLRAQGYRGPIVALTAHCDDLDRNHSLEAGCDVHVSKPVDWDWFADRIRTLIASPNSGDGRSLPRPV
jgi:CheY-like chemotaxis protein